MFICLTPTQNPEISTGNQKPKLLKEILPYILREKMAEGQMFKNLPEECLLKISSFMLGTPQQLKIKQSNTFKQI